MVNNKSKSEKPLVLVADPDAAVRELVSHFVREAGYEVICTTEGYEALDTARKLLPVAVLADVLLPKLDGLALCRLLKGDPQTQHIVTVVVFSVLAAEERSKRAGADAFIKKPLEKNRVLRILEKATSGGARN